MSLALVVEMPHQDVWDVDPLLRYRSPAACVPAGAGLSTGLLLGRYLSLAEEVVSSCCRRRRGRAACRAARCWEFLTYEGELGRSYCWEGSLAGITNTTGFYMHLIAARRGNSWILHLRVPGWRGKWRALLEQPTPHELGGLTDRLGVPGPAIRTATTKHHKFMYF